MASHNETLRTNSFAAPLCSSSFPLWLRLFFFLFSFFLFFSPYSFSCLAYSWYYVIFPSSTCSLLANTPLLLPRSIYYHFVLRFYFMALDACSILYWWGVFSFYSTSRPLSINRRGYEGGKGENLMAKIMSFRSCVMVGFTRPLASRMVLYLYPK